MPDLSIAIGSLDFIFLWPLYLREVLEVFSYIYIHFSLLTAFLYLFVLYHSCCSHAEEFWKTLVHDFHISYGHSECIFLIVVALNEGRVSKIKQ